MTQNAKMARVSGGPSQKDHGGGLDASLPQPTDNAQQPGLFPGDKTKPITRPLAFVTRGRVEYLARCPGCGRHHRHVHLGNVTGPCGTAYIVKPKANLKGAA